MTVKTPSKPSFQSPPNRYWPPPQGEWTYEDYTRLPDNGMRYEVIKGELYMTPAPSPRHQRALAILHGYLWEYLQDQPVGEVFFAPIDVIFPDLANPVQPDLLFIVNDRLSMVKDDGIEGVPDLIVEVLSPGNPMYDRRTKFQIYAQAGVREYWIVDLEACVVEVNVLRGQAYVLLAKFKAEEQIRSEVLADFTVRVGEICRPS